MFFLKSCSLILFLCVHAGFCEVLVQLNVNKPLYDVSEKFVSFSINPEDLYKSLDSVNRKSILRMSELIGPSYIKLTGDYYFANNGETKMRNPTKVIWKGFNRWARAVNWTMIIPVSYTPNSWDPMHALKILNTSYDIGISDCIWQLGLDFGASRAEDYVTDLNTLNLMVETFRPYVHNWQIVGADITAGSSDEETRRYIDLSKNLNVAFGWTQPPGRYVDGNRNGYIDDNDPALRMLSSKNVPLWLTVPPNPKNSQNENNKFSSMEASEGIRWAMTLGNAANYGFETVFKSITIDEIDQPRYSFFISAAFKKLMGSRVFPAKTLAKYSKSTKLYTHCANAVSGGLAFMIVNFEEHPLKVLVRSTTAFTGSEVWQYVLSFRRGSVYLNNDRLSLNTTLEPVIRIKHPNKPVSISMPPMCVGFWVLPLVNLEHCQFTEMESNEPKDKVSWVGNLRKITSSDRLLQKLIFDSSLTDKIQNNGNRRRREPTNNRAKRFILQESSDKIDSKRIGKKVIRLSTTADKKIRKREDAMNWLKSFVLNPININTRNFKSQSRSRRSAGNLFSTIFSKDLKKPEPKIAKIKKSKMPCKHHDDLFDEERYFNTDDVQKLDQFPQGDVHFKYITNVMGNDVNTNAKEIINNHESEIKPIRELPTEFYESLPTNYKTGTETFEKNSHAKKLAPYSDSDVEVVTKSSFFSRGQLAKDFLEEQFQLSKSFFENEEAIESESKRSSSNVMNDFGLDQYRKQNENLEKYLLEVLPERKINSAIYQDDSSSWERNRPRRSVSSRRGKIDSWFDNLIPKDDDYFNVSKIKEQRFNDDETFGEEQISNSLPSKLVAEVKKNATKFVDVISRHISDWLTTFTK